MPTGPEWQEYPSRAEASAAAAALLAGLLRSDLELARVDSASLVVSGGSTPGPCFELLSGKALDWSKVTVLPSDERWVPAQHADSNERLVRETLLKGPASVAGFLRLYRSGVEPAGALSLIEADLEHLRQPFSAVLLGMGEDGHFASLFPDYPGLPQALETDSPASCVVVQTCASPHPRISLTLAALVNARHIALLIFGEAKRRVVEAALADTGDYPVAALLQQNRCPVTVMWSA